MDAKLQAFARNMDILRSKKEAFESEIQSLREEYILFEEKVIYVSLAVS